jgi:hypothetical protein
MSIDAELWLFLGYFLGFVLGYIIWAPDTRFKQAFLSGLTLEFIWRRWR